MLSRSIRQSRGFFSVSVPQLSGIGGVQSTKYRITRPGREGTIWDDLLIALPEKDHLAKFSKEVPLFIRYLKLVTDKEGRPDDFTEFVTRCKAGLTVESDAFISTDELLAVMWKNGYTEEERNAIQCTFPSEYKFHYPELAVLFDLTEEDCYKFCVRTRMEKSHIGELDFDAVKRKGFIRDHWVLWGLGVCTLSQFPFFNYYFFTKVFGTTLWFGTNWMLASRSLGYTMARNLYMAQQKTAHELMEGEDKIMNSMKRFANDAKCVDHLKSFKGEVQEKLSSYRAALLKAQEVEINSRITKQLAAVAQHEGSMNAQLQEMVVREAAASFKDIFASNDAMKAAAFDSALAGIAGKSSASDPVVAHFNQAIADVGKVDLLSAKANAAGTIVERLAAVQQKREQEFKESFMVTAEEAKEVKAIVSKAKSGDGFDFSALDETSANRLEELYKTINNKVGFVLTHETQLSPIALGEDAKANKYIESVNQELALVQAKLKNARLSAFASAFA